MVEPHSSNFRVIKTNFLGVRIFRKFTVYGFDNTSEPRHEKMYLRESLTRPDTNWPAQPQKLARFLKFQP